MSTIQRQPPTHPPNLDPLPLYPSITETYIPSHDLTYHVLESGSESSTSSTRPPLLLLLHGFPEIAYSWRKIMPDLAKAGFTVVAYDQRGYGRTTGWQTGSSFSGTQSSALSYTGLVRDAVILVNALGYQEVECVIGHDFGAVGASMCALMRPDIFKSVIMMSHPFKGSPSLPTIIPRGHHNNDTSETSEPTIHMSLADLEPPRIHYKKYYAGLEAAREMDLEPLELQRFLRNYFYLKSANWPGNEPHQLSAWKADTIAEMPWYYVMLKDISMPENCQLLVTGVDVRGGKDVKSKGPRMWFEKSSDPTTSEKWLPNEELDVYVNEWHRTGFQGALNWYGVGGGPLTDLELFAGRKIDVPSLFISGDKDWGMYQEPGVVENMAEVCTDFKGVKIVDGAGHWVQQERPQEVIELVLEFLKMKDVQAGSAMK